MTTMTQYHTISGDVHVSAYRRKCFAVISILALCGFLYNGHDVTMGVPDKDVWGDA